MKEATAKRLETAARAIRAAERLLADGDADFAVSRAYYAMFYTAEALLHEMGLRFRKHSGVHNGFAQHLVKAGAFEKKYHRWLVEAFQERIAGDYWVEPLTTREQVQTRIDQAMGFLAAARAYLEKQTG